MKPNVVCNTGPLIALSIIGCQRILEQIFQPVIARQVLDEWAAGVDFKPGELLRGCRIVDVSEINPLVAVQLDAGEAAVIQAALDLGIGTVLIDERKGRKLARRLCGLVTLGTAGLLVQAKRAGIVPLIEPLFEELEDASYWIAPMIVDWALEQVGESGAQ